MASRSSADQRERSVPFGKYWHSRPLSVFVGRALPGAVRVGEVDWDASGDRERGVLGEFFPAIPGQ